MYASVVIPAFDCAADLAEVLAAVEAGRPGRPEVVVADDASTDATGGVAEAGGARCVRLDRNRGPAAARNVGARAAVGEVLVFVDADVVPAPGAVDRLVRILAERSDVAAVFGSYDRNPRADNVVSRYRNLLHHFVHQQGNPAAETFWAGCGAVRRSAFDAVGGFDEQRFPRSSIEDIDLGYRLRRAGYRIVLEPTIQGTHLKRWTLASMVWTDVVRRAIPWARLIAEEDRALDHLNVQRSQRVAAVCAALACLCLVLTPWRPVLLLGTVAAVAGMVLLNRGLFTLFARRYGLAFAAACIPLHMLYYLYSGLAYALVRIERRVGWDRGRRGTMKKGKWRRGALVALMVTTLGLSSCASGWRSCREWTDLAAKDTRSGDIGGVIPGIIYLAMSPIACATSLVLSPVTELTDRREEPEEPVLVVPTPTPGYDSPAP
ncbi:MAG: glycosyltransferase family 2 protein [Candidatus Binatia bacterium]